MRLFFVAVISGPVSHRTVYALRPCLAPSTATCLLARRRARAGSSPVSRMPRFVSHRTTAAARGIAGQSPSLICRMFPSRGDRYRYVQVRRVAVASSRKPGKSSHALCCCGWRSLAHLASNFIFGLMSVFGLLSVAKKPTLNVTLAAKFCNAIAHVATTLIDPLFVISDCF